MKASLPSSHHDSNELNRDKRNYDYSLRSWAEVARLYSEKTGEKMSSKHAEHIHARALKKLALALDKAENIKLRNILDAELD